MRKQYFVAGLCCVLGIVLIVLDMPTFGIVCVGCGIAAWEVYNHARRIP